MLINSCFRNVNNPTVPLSRANILDYIGGGVPSKSGQTVTERTIMMLAPVWQCVNMISGDIAKLPLEVFVRTGPTSREKDKKHPAYYPLARMANPIMPSFRLWRRFMLHGLLWQRAYIWVKRPGPNRIELYNLLPDRTYFDPGLKNDMAPFGMYVSKIGNDTDDTYFFPSEILEYEGLAVDDSNGCKLSLKAKDSMGVALATQEFKSKFYRNGAHSGGYLEIPNTMTPLAADNLEEGFRKRHSGTDNWFSTVILRDGAKFHATTFDPAKQQLVEATEQQAIEVCRWFNIQPGRIGVQGSESYGSKEQDNAGYFDQTLSHHACIIRTECWNKLLTEEQKQNDTHIIEHNKRAIFAMNAKTQAEVGAIEINLGVLSPNEYRAATNRNPIPGGDIRTIPKNMYLIDGEGVILNPDAQSPPAADVEPDDEPDAPTEASVNARLVFDTAVNYSMRKCLITIRKEAHRKDAGRFCKWWDTKRQAFSNDMIGEIDAAARVYAHVEGIEPAAVIEDVRGRTIEVLTSEVDEALERCQVDELRAELYRICDEWTEKPKLELIK